MIMSIVKKIYVGNSLSCKVGMIIPDGGSVYIAFKDLVWFKLS